MKEEPDDTLFPKSLKCLDVSDVGPDVGGVSLRPLFPGAKLPPPDKLGEPPKSLGILSLATLLRWLSCR
jgi:hypothetical protein